MDDILEQVSSHTAGNQFRIYERGKYFLMYRFSHFQETALKWEATNAQAWFENGKNVGTRKKY